MNALAFPGFEPNLRLYDFPARSAVPLEAEGGASGRDGLDAGERLAAARHGESR